MEAAGASAIGGRDKPDGNAAHKEANDIIGSDPADDAILLDLERIPSHRDHSLVVVNVALNSGFKGGQLIDTAGGRPIVAAGGQDSGGRMMSQRGGPEIASQLGDAPLSAGGCHGPRLCNGARRLWAGVRGQALSIRCV